MSDLDSFKSITGATDQVAQQYLAENTDLNAAIATYFEVQQSMGDNDDAMQPEEPASVPSGTQTLSGAPATTEQAWPSSSSSSAGPRRAGFATLNDFADQSTSKARDSDDSEDESDKPQSYFTGGEKSGLSVEDPNAGKGHKKLIQSLLKKAAEGGVAPDTTSKKSAAGPSYFGGSANTLGSDDVPSQAIPDPSSSSKKSSKKSTSTMPGSLFGGPSSSTNVASDDEDEENDTEGETATRRLTFWSDGFSIDDGPLMRYDDPANQEILENLNQGRAPLHLLGIKFGQRVDIQVAERRSEAYRPPPKAPMKAFEGSGNRLGSPAPELSTRKEEPKAPSTASKSFEPSQTLFEVDPSLPTTNIQIRLPNGERVVTRFNQTHRVADIRSYVNASQPEVASRSYVLQLTFPSRDLKDESQTIKEAGLLGSVVVLRYT